MGIVFCPAYFLWCFGEAGLSVMGQVFIRLEYQIASSILKNWFTDIADWAQDNSDYCLCFQLPVWVSQIP